MAVLRDASGVRSSWTNSAIRSDCWNKRAFSIATAACAPSTVSMDSSGSVNLPLFLLSTSSTPTTLFFVISGMPNSDFV